MMKNCRVCLTRNFVQRSMLVIVKFRFAPEIRGNSVLCSREISLKRPRIVTRTKNEIRAFRLRYFCTILDVKRVKTNDVLNYLGQYF